MEKEEAKRDKILDAALVCLGRYGFLKATLDDIAAVLGMKKASLYYYYKNKEAIFFDALEREVMRLKSELENQFNETMTASEKLNLFVILIVRYFSDRAEMMELDVNAMIDNHLLIQKLHNRLCSKQVDFLADIIQEGIARGEFRAGDPHKLAKHIRIILNAGRIERFHALQSARLTASDFEEMKEAALFKLDLLLNGLKTR